MERRKFLHVFLIVFIFMLTFINCKVVLAVGGGDILLIDENNQALGSIFNDGDQAGGWAPGSKVTKKFNISNGSDKSYYLKSVKLDMKLKSIGSDKYYNPGDTAYDDFVKHVGAKLETGLWNMIYNESIEKLTKGVPFTASYLLNSNSSRKFDITVWMDEQAGNSLQGVECKFDIVFTCNTIDKPTNPSDNTEEHGHTPEIVTPNPPVTPPVTPPAVTPPTITPATTVPDENPPRGAVPVQPWYLKSISKK